MREASLEKREEGHDAALGAFYSFLEVVMLFVQFLEMLVVMQKCVNNRLIVLEH